MKRTIRVASTSLALAATLLSAALYAQIVRITGQITDPDGRAISGATVLAQQQANPSTYRVLTDERGNYALNIGGAGTWIVTVSAGGYPNAEARVEVLPTAKMLINGEPNQKTLDLTLEQ